MSGYIMYLRKLVGHRPILQVGASVIVEDSKGRILQNIPKEISPPNVAPIKKRISQKLLKL